LRRCQSRHARGKGNGPSQLVVFHCSNSSVKRRLIGNGGFLARWTHEPCSASRRRPDWVRWFGEDGPGRPTETPAVALRVRGSQPRKSRGAAQAKARSQGVTPCSNRSRRNGRWPGARPRTPRHWEHLRRRGGERTTGPHALRGSSGALWADRHDGRDAQPQPSGSTPRLPGTSWQPPSRPEWGATGSTGPG
jgi:hypothetical protein